MRRCVPVIIFEDSEEEGDESFVVSMSGMEVTTTVTILGDDSEFKGHVQDK